MQNLKLFLLIALPVLLITACRDDDDSSSQMVDDALDFMPLEVGAYWVYDTENASSSEPTSTDTIEVVASFADGEDTIYELESTSSFLSSAFIPTRLRLRDGKLYFDDEDNTNLFLTVSTEDAGTIIYTEDIPQDLGVINYSYDDELASITTSAGSFDCVNIEGEILANDTSAPAHESRLNNFFAEGVGLVSARRFFWSNGAPIDIKLVEFFLP